MTLYPNYPQLSDYISLKTHFFCEGVEKDVFIKI
jgi:hypothetical protein